MPHPDQTPTDQELIAALNAGDTMAFEMIYLRHREWVVNLALRITGDHDSAFTVLQETFRYLADKFPGFVLTCQLRTFFYPVVKNLSLMQIRRTDRIQRIEEKLAPDENAEWPRNAGSPTHDLEELLGCLSLDHREVVLLRYVDELEVGEIARMLGIPAGTVKSRLHHALRLLRNSPATRRYFGKHD